MISKEIKLGKKLSSKNNKRTEVLDVLVRREGKLSSSSDDSGEHLTAIVPCIQALVQEHDEEKPTVSPTFQAVSICSTKKESCGIRIRQEISTQLKQWLRIDSLVMLAIDFAIFQPFTIFNAHEYPVSKICYSPDGWTVASGSLDTTVKLWSIPEQRLHSTISGNKNWIRSLSFSPDGKTILTGSGDNRSKIWRVSDGRLLHTLLGYISCFSPDGMLVATGSLRDNLLRLYFSSSGARIRVMRGHTSAINAIDFSPSSGGKILTGSSDTTLRLWTPGSLEQVVFRGHKGWVTAAVFSLDNEHIVSGSSDFTVKVWQSDGTLLRTLYQHCDWVSGISRSPVQNSVIATCSHDSTIKLWCIVTGKELFSFQGKDRIFDVKFSPCGQYLIAGNHAQSSIHVVMVPYTVLVN